MLHGRKFIQSVCVTHMKVPNMAKEEIGAWDLVAYEDSLREILHRLLKLREKMQENNDETINVNIGTFRHAISEADKYSSKIVDDYNRIARTEIVKIKLAKNKIRRNE